MTDLTTYRKQVALIMRVLPIIAQEDCFVLKGGTAINLFIRNMPRLSVASGRNNTQPNREIDSRNCTCVRALRAAR